MFWVFFFECFIGHQHPNSNHIHKRFNCSNLKRMRNTVVESWRYFHVQRRKKLNGNTVDVSTTSKAGVDSEFALETFYTDFIKKISHIRFWRFNACDITITTRQTHKCLFVFGTRQRVRFVHVTRRLIYLFFYIRVHFLCAYWSPETFRLS